MVEEEQGQPPEPVRPVAPGSDASARGWGRGAAIFALVIGAAGAIYSLFQLMTSPRPPIGHLVSLANGTLMVALAVWSFRRRQAALLAMSAQVCTNVLLTLTLVFALGGGRDWTVALGVIGGALLVATLFVVALIKGAESEGHGTVVVFVLGLFVLITVVQIVLTTVWMFSSQGDLTVPVCAAAFVTGGGALLAWRLRPDLRVGWGPPRAWHLWVWPVACAGILGWTAGRYIELLVYAFGPSVLDLQKALEGLSRTQRIAFLVVAAPVAEEILFRGYFQEALKSIWGAPTAILATALLFAVAHAMPVMFPVLLLAGLTLGLAKHYSGSILPGLAFHGVYNAMGLL